VSETLVDSTSAVAAPLDLLLTEAGRGGGHVLPLGTTVTLGRALVSRPRRVATHAGSLLGELGRVVTGSSSIVPTRRDRRFADPAWTGNFLLRRLAQSYLATSRAAEGLVQDLPMEWRDSERVRFVVAKLIEALAPSNSPLTSPEAWKELIDTGGASAVRGVNNLVRDMLSAPRVPSMVDLSAFEVGENLASTPGVVLRRTPMYELIQYTPTTETVHAEPVLVVPPTINKFYVLDLAPGRSLVEHLVANGHQVFMVSWRNPDARHCKWGVDAYAQSILDAAATAREVADAERAHLLAACSGGILAAVTASHLAASDGLSKIGSLTLLVTVLDQARLGTTGAFTDERSAQKAMARSRRKGYLDGRDLAELFAWLRPGDLVWNYWVNNYLLGRQPPAFDILAWNADTTRMTSRLHADFIKLAMSNALTRPGGATALGTEIDLRRVSIESYVVAGVTDHICPWDACFRSAQLLGGSTRFVLSTSGHTEFFKADESSGC
jgi:polyhydroxyalkanoate synthase